MGCFVPPSEIMFDARPQNKLCLVVPKGRQALKRND